MSKLNEKPKQSNQNDPSHLRLLDSTTRALMQHKVSARAFQVFIVILYHRHRKTGKCKLYTETIAEEIGAGRRSVERALDELGKKKLLSWKSGRGTSGRGLQGGNEYFFPESLLYPDSVSNGKSLDVTKKASPASSRSAQESLDEYLARKQQEFPQHQNPNVKEIHADFLSKCGSEKYPNMKPTRRKFDDWLANQDEPMDMPANQIEELFDEEAFFKQKYGSKNSF